MAQGNKRVKGDGKGRQGGRQKGTPNKVNKEKRELIGKFIADKWDDFVQSYEKLDPEKKCHIMVDLLPFAIPKLSSIDYKGKATVKTMNDELDEISGEKTRK